MPTYSYRCTECGTAFDTVQAFSDDSLTVCPSCGGKLRKLFSAVGVTFNGSGFYRNDSRAGGSSETGGKSGSSDGTGSSGSGSGSSSGGSGDAKPSTPAPSTPASTSPAKGT